VQLGPLGVDLCFGALLLGLLLGELGPLELLLRGGTVLLGRFAALALEPTLLFPPFLLELALGRLRAHAREQDEQSDQDERYDDGDGDDGALLTRLSLLLDGMVLGVCPLSDTVTPPPSTSNRIPCTPTGRSPRGEVVARAADAGVRLLSLTDHDTVDGVAEALAAGAQHGVHVVPAAELSAVHGDQEDLHILGYGLDHSDPILRETLRDWRADRSRRIVAMADRLEALGFALDRAELDERTGAGKPLGRPHLAQALLAHPSNRERLERENIHGLDELFPAYLVPGASAYVGRTRPTVAQAIDAIHAAGGLAVWAHPFWNLDDPTTRSKPSTSSEPAALTASSASTSPTRKRRPGCCTTGVARAICSRRGPPTSTAPSMSGSTPFAPLRFTGCGRTSAAWLRGERVLFVSRQP
jgi:predicted metal-dependent phosphoesterase TrpH